MKMRVLVLSSAVMAVSSVASAELFIGPTILPVPVATFSHVLDDTAPTYQRPVGITFGTPAVELSATANAVRYRSNSFVSTGRVYSFFNSLTRTAPVGTTGGWQQHLYTPSFDPANALTNNISAGATFTLTLPSPPASPVTREVNYNLAIPAGPITVVNTLSNNTLRANVTTVVATDDGLIPDNNPTGVSFTLNITSPGTISSFNSIILRSLQHTFAGDLRATLSNGTVTVPLFTNLPGSLPPAAPVAADLSSDFNGTYTIADGGATFPVDNSVALIPAGTYAPQSTLSAFVGQPLAGTWTLSLVDTEVGATGRITGFDLDIATSPTLVKGDFGGNESPDGSFNSPDGTFDGLDIEGFLLALNSQASYLALNPSLSTSLVALGDFGGNESTDGSFNSPDGAFDGLDIEGFLLALNDPAGYAAIQPPGFGGVSAIPEPAALGLLAPMGLLLSRRRPR